MYRTLQHEAEIHKALYAFLQSVGNVYDAVPENPQFPFLVIGDPEVSEGEVKDVGNNYIVFPIHIFSRYRGKKEVYSLVQDVLQILPLLEAINNLRAVIIGYDIFYQNEDDEVKHAIIRVKIKSFE